MSQIGQIKAERRDRVGKGAARAARRNGRVPAVIYGLGESPEAITLSFSEVLKRVNSGRFMSTLLDVDIGGKVERVIPRDVQLDVVTDFPVHVDFLRLGKDTKISVNVPVHFENQDDCDGIRRGGVLNIVRHEVELLCPAESIPDFVIADLAGLDIGDGVHISNIPLPDGVEPTITDRDFTIATIAAPSGGVGEDEEEGEGAEGEEGEVAEGAAAEGDAEGGDEESED